VNNLKILKNFNIKNSVAAAPVVPAPLRPLTLQDFIQVVPETQLPMPAPAIVEPAAPIPAGKFIKKNYKNYLNL
jgi:hypothetical protein